jgi:lycopene cyclase CruP
MKLIEKMLANLPGDVLENLHRADQLWQNLKNGTTHVPQVVHQRNTPLGEVDWDVVICGGTLGILIGVALAQRGWRVALLERGILRGREQEWNISRQELAVFLELGLLNSDELEQAIATEFNPVRISFGGGPELWVRDVLNTGVDPVFLLETLKSRFLEYGGKLLENTAFEQAVIYPDGVVVQAEQPFKARLMLDAMGHFSPVVAQARQGKQPEGICLVVGTCAQGLPNHQTADLLASFTPLQRQCQYFWEAFPAHDGRTTYLFTYIDTHPDRLSLETLFEDYFHLLPEYQGIALEQIHIQRALFGIFPCYRQSPLKTPWDRILPVGDSSGSQSPLSFGGFGAIVRHLKRLDSGIHEALESDALSAQALALLQPYQPSLAVTWLFQRAMSAKVEQKLDADQINRLLSIVFQTMEQLGDPVLRPFLQDIVQFPALSQTLFSISLKHPGLIPKILTQVGPMALLDWMNHYLKLGLYSSLYFLTPIVNAWSANLPSIQQYYWHRWVDAWKYGSGSDYHH